MNENNSSSTGHDRPVHVKQVTVLEIAVFVPNASGDGNQHLAANYYTLDGRFIGFFDPQAPATMTLVEGGKTAD